MIKKDFCRPTHSNLVWAGCDDLKKKKDKKVKEGLQSLRSLGLLKRLKKKNSAHQFFPFLLKRGMYST